MINGKTVWTGKMQFQAHAGGHMALQDAKTPVGEGSGMTPKEMVVVGLCGCTAMDVIALMKKHKQDVQSFEVRAEVQTTDKGHPAVFLNVLLTFELKGNIEAEKLIEAVHLSQTKYCGVSAMLEKAVPIQYRIVLNEKQIGEGHAHFSGAS